MICLELALIIISKVVLDPKTSKRIFELAKIQQHEMEVPDDDEDISQSPGDLSRPRLYPEDEEEDEDSSIGEEPGDVEEEFVRLVPLPELISGSGLYIANRLWGFENIRCITTS